jgi:hypothetical protein
LLKRRRLAAAKAEIRKEAKVEREEAKQGNQ